MRGREERNGISDCGLLRLDIRSDYEMSDTIIKILSLIIAPAYRLFHCSKIATKAIPAATERIQALKNLGFELSAEKLVGDVYKRQTLWDASQQFQRELR